MHWRTRHAMQSPCTCSQAKCKFAWQQPKLLLKCQQLLSESFQNSLERGRFKCLHLVWIDGFFWVVKGGNDNEFEPTTSNCGFWKWKCYLSPFTCCDIFDRSIWDPTSWIVLPYKALLVLKYFVTNPPSGCRSGFYPTWMEPNESSLNQDNYSSNS